MYKILCDFIKKNKLSFIVFFIDILLFIFTFFPYFIEKYYVPYFFTFFSLCIRTVIHIFPCSMGDILYSIICAFFILKLIIILKNKQPFLTKLKKIGIFIFKIALWFYLIFNVVWGLNYHRPSVLIKMNMQLPQTYTLNELTKLKEVVILKMNENRKQISTEEVRKMNQTQIIKNVIQQIQILQIQYPFLNVKFPSIKKSVFSIVGDYLSYSGYFNPFTQESQIRFDYPPVLNPFIVCHELAHQMGYAKENEANFIAAFICMNTTIPYFKYAAYMEVLPLILSEERQIYALNKDTIGYKNAILQTKLLLDSTVKLDFIWLKDFFDKKNNKINKVSRKISTSWFNQFLKLNKQNNGILSYNEIIQWYLRYELIVESKNNK